MTKKEIKKLYELCEDDLIHFISQEGWPIYIDNVKKRELLFKHIPALSLNSKGRVELNRKIKIDPNLLAYFWEQQYNFVSDELSDLYDKLSELTGE